MLPDGTDVIVNAALTFQFGVTETIGSLSGAGQVVFAQDPGNHLIVGQNNADTVFSGVITDLSVSATGALSKIGTGTLTLSGNSTYSEGTNINGGALAVSADNNLGDATGPLTFDGGTLRFNAPFDLAPARAITLSAGGGTLDTNANNTTISQVITGSGGLTKAGAGTLTLSGINTHSGGTILSDGTLSISSNGNLGGASGTVTFGGGTLRIDSPTGQTFPVSRAFVTDGADAVFELAGANTVVRGGISGDGSLVVNGVGGAFFLSDTPSTYSGSTTANDQLGISSNEMLPDSTDVILNSVLTLHFGVTETIGSLSGAGTVLFLQGTGNHLIVGQNNTDTVFSGSIRDLSVSATGALSKIGTGTLTLSGIFSTYSEGTNINGGAIAVSADINLGAATGPLTFDGGTLRFNAPFDLAPARAITLNVGGGTFDTNTHNTTISQAIAGTGSLTKLGAGTLTLNAANAYSGGTTINGGTLSLGNSAAAGPGTITVLGSTIDYADTVNIANAIDLQNNATLNVSSGSATQSGVISETGGPWGVTKTGAGTLTLSGINTHSGGTTIEAGTVSISSNVNLGTGDITFTGGLLSFDSPFVFNNHTMIATPAGDARIDTQTLVQFSSGAIIQGEGGFVKTGPATMLVLSNNTYQGSTQVLEGALDLRGGAGERLPDLTDVLLVNVVFALNKDTGVAETIGSLSGSGSVFFSNFTNQILRVGANNSDSTFDGTIGTLSGGNGALTKIGTGTLTLSGNSTYSEGTNINGGTLLANNTAGSATGTGAVIVNSGGTLDGTGTVSGTVTVNSGGTVAPGVSPGILTLGAVNFGAGSTLVTEIDSSGGVAGTDFDVLDVTTTANLDGALFADMGFTPAHQESFQVMSFGSHSGVFSSVTDSGLPDCLIMAPFYTATDLTLSVELLGDANGNGTVDAADYTVWANGFGTAEPSYDDGDLNRNGQVDAADYTIWANKFGTVVVGPSGAGHALAEPLPASAVPEPSTLVLLLIGAVTLLWRRTSK